MQGYTQIYTNKLGYTRINSLILYSAPASLTTSIRYFFAKIANSSDEFTGPVNPKSSLLFWTTGGLRYLCGEKAKYGYRHLHP